MVWGVSIRRVGIVRSRFSSMKSVFNTSQNQMILTNLTYSYRSSSCFAATDVTRRCFGSSSKSESEFSYDTGLDDSEIVVSILGPPNAGKSTLFNQLMCKEANKTYKLTSEKKKRKGGAIGRVGSKMHKNKKVLVGGAIVSPVPGTTRDRRECIGRIGGTTFRLVDTAGVDGERIGHLYRHNTKNPLEKQMMQQTLEAARTSDLVLLMLDAKVGITYDLIETAKWLRKIGGSVEERTVAILANKLEGDSWVYDDSPVLDTIDEVNRVGFGEAIPISAEHGEGLADIAALIEEIQLKKRERLGISEDEEDAEDTSDQEKPLQLAILGRQNVGKSTLVNALLQQQRVLSGATPGLTRDAITVEWSWKGRPVKLVDTAGIRRGVQRDHSNVIEDLAVRDAMRAMKVADVAVLVLDAEARYLQRQELAIADAVVKEGRSIIVVANKMDLIVDAEYTKEEYAEAVTEQMEIRFPLLRKTPVVPMSSLTGECVQDLMPVVFSARDRWARTISTGTLNRWLEEVLFAFPPPRQKGRETKIKYIMQTKGRPPTFLLFCNVSSLPQNYLRYLTRNFQDTFKFFGMEVRLAIKKSAESNPYEKNIKQSWKGVGGWQGRKKRLIRDLREHGRPLPKGRRRRFQPK